MKTGIKDISPGDLRKLIEDVKLIKNILLEEGEMTDWAKNELKSARKRPEKEYASLGKVKRNILSKKN